MNHIRTKILRLMHDIAELSEIHDITEIVEFDNYRLKIENKSKHRFGSVQLDVYKTYEFSKKIKSSWDTITMYIRTSRNRERIGSISYNMVFANALHEKMNKIVESNFSEDDGFIGLEVPPELDQSEDIRDAFIFQKSLLDNYKEFEYLMLCYDTAKVLDCGELVMYNDFINYKTDVLNTLLQNIESVKEKYERL